MDSLDGNMISGESIAETYAHNYDSALHDFLDLMEKNRKYLILVLK